MRIGCLQFAPKLGEVNQNMNRADAILSKSKHAEDLKNLDLLVLPELAFTGYNFKSLAHILPYLEPTASGITQLWARTQALKHNCAVTVGYPEKVDISARWPCSPEYYNSTVTINRDGETAAHYRKHFLYSTDETWALEGPDGFGEAEIKGLGKVALGFCMDLNPYRFDESPWDAFEFAHHVLHVRADLVIVSMAWTTREPLDSYSRTPHDPDMHTLAYWLRRLDPLIRNGEEGEIIVVLANRAGEENGVVYTGTSCVLGINKGEVSLYGILGRQERDLLVIDTNFPVAKLIQETEEPMESSTNSNDSSGSKNSQESDNTDPDYCEPSIEDILQSRTPISPVEAKSPHPFFNSHPDMDQRQELRSSMVYDDDEEYEESGWATYAEMLKSSNNVSYQTLKSASNGPNRRDSSTPFEPINRRRDTATPDSWERPGSPKSRNASRNRHAAAQSPALREHDLADCIPSRKSSGVPFQTDRRMLGSNSAQAIRDTARRLNPPILYSQWDLDPTDPDNEIVEIIDEAKGIRETVMSEVEHTDPEDFHKEHTFPEHQLPRKEYVPIKDPDESLAWAAELPSHSRRRAERLLPYSQVNSEVSVRPRSTGW